MEKKRILKGLLRLTIALVVTCGVGLSLFGTEVKAFTNPTATIAESGDQIELNITSDPDAIAKEVKFYLDGNTDPIYTETLSSTQVKIGKDKYLSKINSSTTITSGKAQIKASIFDGSGVKVAEATGTAYTLKLYKVEPTSSSVTGISSIEIESAGTDAVKVSDKLGYALENGSIKLKATPATGYAIKTWTVTNHTEGAHYTIASDKTLTIGKVVDDCVATPEAAAVPKIVVKDSDGNEVTTSVSLKPSTADSIFTASGCDGYTYLWEKVEDATNMGSTTTTNPEKLNISHIKAGTCKWTISAKKAGAPTPEPITITFTCADPVIDRINLMVGGKPYTKSEEAITIAPKTDVECTIKAFDKDGNDVTSSFSFTASTSNTSFKITPSGSTFKINGAGGGLTATVAVTASKDSTDKKSNTFTFVTSGFSVSIDADPAIPEPKETVVLTGSITPAASATDSVTYKWTVSDGSTSKNYNGQKISCKDFKKETAYTVKLEVTKNGVTEEATTTITPYKNPTITISPKTIIITTGETVYINGIADTNLFEGADADDIDIDFDSASGSPSDFIDKYSVTSASKKSCAAWIKAGNKATDSGTKLTLQMTYDSIESDIASVHVYKKPSVSKTVNSGSDQSVTFNLPGYVGTSKTANMTVTGYKIKIFKDGICVKTIEDVKPASAGEKTIKISEIINEIASVASGDSYTFKVGIQPCGKVNNTGDVVGATTVDSSSGKDSDFVSDLSGEFTVYRLNLTADAGITVSPAATWGVEKQTTEVKATGVVGYWTRNGVKIEGTDGKQSYTHTFSSTTADNRIGAVLGASVPGAAGGAAGGATAGLDDVPKTAESNAPIWLIIVLVFAAMGGGYALYMQMKPVKVKNAPKTPFVNGDDDYDDNF